MINGTASHVDIKTVNDAARARIPELVQQWLPGGRWEKDEYVVRNPKRQDSKPGSFKINRDGPWADFATGDAGGDPVSLLAYIQGIGQVPAARKLADDIGLQNEARGQARSATARPDDGWTPIIPVPADAPKLTNDLVSRFAPPGMRLTKAYVYRDAAAASVGIVARYSGEAGKAFKPFLYCNGPHGRPGWRCKGFPTPRPLYGLHVLAENPELPILVVEGEKTANEADRLFNDYVVVSSLNGAQSAAKTDWSPLAGRDVVIWPDADEPGAKYAAEVVELVKKAGAKSIRIVKLPPDLSEGWDLADELPPGLTHADLERLLAKPAASNAASEGASSWPEPKPLPSSLLPVMSFDSDMVPACLGPWIADIAERMQCPSDFVGIPAVVALASTLGRKIAVRPQSKTDWIEVPNLWGCIVGRPGAMKSPAMAEALKPLNRLEAEARTRNEEALKEYALDLVAYKLKQDEGQKAARAAIKAGADDIRDLIGLDEPVKPAARRYIVGDTTYEALGEILVSNPNGILAFRDELISLLKTLDREEYVNARGFFLTGWNGTSGYPFDRISRGSTYIDAVCISLLGSTQPGRLSEYLSRVMKDGAGNDGLLQRFALLVWPDDNGTWREVDRYPDSQARATAWDTFTRLNLLTADQAGAERGEYVGHGPIGETALLRAIAFAEYLESHAKRAYGSGTQLEAATAKAILTRIRKGDIADQFTARDILRHDWSNLTDKEQIAAGLDLLDDLDWIRGTKSTTGGRPKVTYAINPRAFQ